MTEENISKGFFISSLICVIIAYIFMYYNLMQPVCIIMIFAIGLFLVSIYGGKINE